ncbi:hypothetical protein HIM_06006 [Hirsutella minnesotensis 3608]|uniref:Large ribosomal subunit protein uL6 alpha-beta domain-containing protein n=1 Tax=Hirsutella minnesotensis 3608 TaxID=1043627 RepID=A0A0F7ZJT2_9HYPO|nr:hypothetical protein HIM_06006 [Hirsutella minnesotensis 3608]
MAAARALRHALRAPLSPVVTLPGFLVPAWQGQRAQRPFSTTTAPCSKLGRTPISIPPGVELTIGEPKKIKSMTSYLTKVTKTVTVKGPLGTLQLDVPDYINLSHNDEEKTVLMSVADANEKRQKEMWGTTWSYLNNHITGVSEGHTAILRLVGIGYRASVEKRGSKEEYPGQPFLCLKLGFTHPIEEGIPKGVTVTTPAPTRILLEGADREVIMSFAGRVRQWRPPEPYKGKGVFINDQTIKLKQKKIK